MAARAQGVAIYTIAYGTPDGYIDIGGRREPVPADRAGDGAHREDLWRGGLHCESAGELRQVYKDIGSSVGKEKVDREVTTLRRLRVGLRHSRRPRDDLAVALAGRNRRPVVDRGWRHG